MRYLYRQEGEYSTSALRTLHLLRYLPGINEKEKNEILPHLQSNLPRCSQSPAFFKMKPTTF